MAQPACYKLTFRMLWGFILGVVEIYKHFIKISAGLEGFEGFIIAVKVEVFGRLGVEGLPVPEGALHNAGHSRPIPGHLRSDVWLRGSSGLSFCGSGMVGFGFTAGGYDHKTCTYAPAPPPPKLYTSAFQPPKYLHNPNSLKPSSLAS